MAAGSFWTGIVRQRWIRQGGSTVEFCQKVSELSAKKSVPGMILVVSEDGSIEVLPAYV